MRRIGGMFKFDFNISYAEGLEDFFQQILDFHSSSISRNLLTSQLLRSTLFLMGKKILLIDDDVDLTNIFKATLEQGQYQVLLAENGQKGIDLAKQELPHLILLDFILPDANGADVLRKLKADEATKAIPVAILSNFGQEDKIKQTFYNGASDFWLKYQLGPEDLVAKVEALLAQNTAKTTP